MRDTFRSIGSLNALRALAAAWAAVALALTVACTAGEGDAAAAGASAGDPSAQSEASGQAAPEPVVFLGVNVLPMDGEEVLRSQAVEVRDGRIVQVAPADRYDPPGDAVRVEASGQWLLPGLAEMHAHIPPEGGREWMEQVLFLYLANGITTVRGMLGQPAHLELREASASGELLAPRIYTSGPSLNGSSIPDPDSARRAVLHQAQAGYDFLKIHPGVSREAYDAIARTADSVGIAWAGHVPAGVGLERALEAGQKSIDHLDQYMEALVPADADAEGRESLFFGVHLVDLVDTTRIPEVARATAEAGVWNVPTQSLIEHVLLPGDPEEMARRPEMRYMPAETVDGWVERKRQFQSHPSWSPDRARRFVEIRHRLIRALQDADAPLLLGSDAPQVFQVPGFSIRAELQMLVDAGLSPHEALHTGTVAVARYFGVDDRRGTVRPGMDADLVLLEANPLDDIGNVGRVAGVMVAGRWVPAEEIQERLDSIAAGHRPD